MNIFFQKDVAKAYDRYYDDDTGKSVDRIEKEMLKKHLTGIKDEVILELGCGTGHWTEFLCLQGFRIMAIDNSEPMLEIAKRKKIRNAVFRKADAAQLPFNNRSFTNIVSVAMLEFAEGLTGIFDEIDRVLKPGGRLILGCLNALSESAKNSQEDPVFKHAHFLTSHEIEDILSRFGNPQLSFGVYLNSNYQLLDGTKQQDTVQPAFIVASVNKNRADEHNH